MKKSKTLFSKKLSRRKTKIKQVKTKLPSQANIEQVSRILLKQINDEIFREKRAKVEPVLKLVGAGLLLAGSIVAPKLPQAILPFFKENEYEAWKRFNLPYLKRTLERLEKQKLVETDEENGVQVVKITNRGRLRVIKCVLDELAVEKPKIWSGTWWVVSYDIPLAYKFQRDVFREYLRAWGFYPLHKSVFLHAYPSFRQVEFLREYLGIGEFVRVFKVSQIENDGLFKDFFGV